MQNQEIICDDFKVVLEGCGGHTSFNAKMDLAKFGDDFNMTHTDIGIHPDHSYLETLGKFSRTTLKLKYS